MEKRNGKLSIRAEKTLKENEEIKKNLLTIVRKLGYVPGKKVFKIHLQRDFNQRVSVKRCARLMKSMSLVANKPKKDAYKHQATHDHICANGRNYVNQSFYKGPRQVILTDITYLYYGPNRTPFYTCAFKDAYTKEILGYASRTRMTVDLVKEAYDMMMKNHSHEFNKPEVFIHSDQGSQYTSTTFKTILEDDGFIQSLSNRGNSQDNAPMESFFGQMKTRIIDIVARCPRFETAKQLVEGFINQYNNEDYQFSLAGLTPSEFYLYTKTGIYPCPKYFGVKVSDLDTVKQLIETRLGYAEREQERSKRRKSEDLDEKNRLKSEPSEQVEKDICTIKKQRKLIEAEIKERENKISMIENTLELSQKALIYMLNLKENDEEAYNKLQVPQEWQNHENLSYIYEMKGML